MDKNSLNISKTENFGQFLFIEKSIRSTTQDKSISMGVDVDNLTDYRMAHRILVSNQS